MSDTPASPKANRLAAPGWLDGRLVLGVLLVLVSVVVGARSLSAADRSQLVWAATGDLAAGSQLQAGDLRPVRVRLFEDNAGLYLPAAGAPPEGYVLRRPIGTGEFLPREAVLLPEQDIDFRRVTVPVERGHFPLGLGHGELVDVWLTPERRPGAEAAPPQEGEPATDGVPAGASADAPEAQALALRGAQQVLAQVPVAVVDARDEFGGAGAVPIVLLVRPNDVAELVSAMGLGRLDLVSVPSRPEAEGLLTPSVEAG